MSVSRIGRLALTFCYVSSMVHRVWAFGVVVEHLHHHHGRRRQHQRAPTRFTETRRRHLHHNIELYSSSRASKDRIAIGSNSDNYDDGDDDDDGGSTRMDDATLLQTVTRAQLVQLCESCRLTVKSTSTKGALLRQLRHHAAEQAAAERERLVERRRRRVEHGDADGGAGGSSSKERYELLDDDDGSIVDGDGDDDQAFFFYAAPEGESNSKNSNSNNKNESAKKKKTAATVLDRSTVTAPPLPPDAPVDEDGRRSVTIYSTTEQNDLTAIAASQPGQQNQLDALSSSAAASSSNHQPPQPWDMEGQATSQSKTSEQALERATGQVVELVSNLLALSGAPAFCLDVDDTLDHDDDGDDDGDGNIPPYGRARAVPKSHSEFVGFAPAAVPTDWLTRASPALRAGRGQVLQDVLRQFELRAVGQDGAAAADDRDRGGGHYAEVAKVRAFLEGYRRAEVRRVARETATLLLDKLCGEGVDGLDLAMSTMVRSSDDTSVEAGVELNDSLVDFLNDAIRQQEKKVDELVAARLDNDKNSVNNDNHNVDDGDDGDDVDNDDDPTQQLWNVTVEDGQRVETLDPNDPKVQRVLEEEMARSEAAAATATAATPIPETAPEKLLLLLTLLRERIRAEAAFAPDEKGRNLRLLAYCLRVSSDEEREQLILSAVGNSLDRLDSFAELTESSIEYGESTSHGLQPAKTPFLNVARLKQILELTRDLRERQAFKAAGLRP